MSKKINKEIESLTRDQLEMNVKTLVRDRNLAEEREKKYEGYADRAKRNYSTLKTHFDNLMDEYRELESQDDTNTTENQFLKARVRELESKESQKEECAAYDNECVLLEMNLGWFTTEDGAKCMPFINSKENANMLRVNYCPSCGKYVRDILI